MCLSLASLGMSSIIKEDARVMEIWIDGHPEKYRLEAKNKKLKSRLKATNKYSPTKMVEDSNEAQNEKEINDSTKPIAPEKIRLKAALKRFK